MRLLVFLMISSLLLGSVKELARELKLYPGTKAKIQWKRIFSSESKLEKYGLDSLDEEEREALKNYLMLYAADSDQPIVPGL